MFEIGGCWSDSPEPSPGAGTSAGRSMNFGLSGTAMVGLGRLFQKQKLTSGKNGMMDSRMMLMRPTWNPVMNSV